MCYFRRAERKDGVKVTYRTFRSPSSWLKHVILYQYVTVELLININIVAFLLCCYLVTHIPVFYPLFINNKADSDSFIFFDNAIILIGLT